MATGDNKGQARERDIPLLQESSFNMGLEMIYPDKRLLKIISQALGKRKPDKKRADESWTLGHSIGIDFVKLEPSPAQAFPDNEINGAQVLARSKLRNNPSIGRMNLILGENNIAQNPEIISEDC